MPPVVEHARMVRLYGFFSLTPAQNERFVTLARGALIQRVVAHLWNLTVNLAHDLEALVLGALLVVLVSNCLLFVPELVGMRLSKLLVCRLAVRSVH